jgi:hypothetical protein
MLLFSFIKRKLQAWELWLDLFELAFRARIEYLWEESRKKAHDACTHT